MLPKAVPLSLPFPQLSSEKADLRRDKAVLKAEVDGLQSQLTARMAAAFAVPWFPGAPYPGNAATSAPPHFPPHPQPFPAFPAMPPPPPVVPEPATPLPAWLGRALQEREQARQLAAASAAAAAAAAAGAAQPSAAGTAQPVAAATPPAAAQTVAAATATAAAAVGGVAAQPGEQRDLDACEVARLQDGKESPPSNAVMMAMPTERGGDGSPGDTAVGGSGVFAASRGTVLPQDLEEAVADRLRCRVGHVQAQPPALPSGTFPSGILPPDPFPSGSLPPNTLPSGILPGGSHLGHALSMLVHAQQVGLMAHDGTSTTRGGDTRPLSEACDTGVASAQNHDLGSVMPSSVPTRNELTVTRAMTFVREEARPLDGEAAT